MATWFAQNSSVNIDSVNQWNSAANGSGSWLTWASLGAADVLVANGKTAIACNVSFTCATITVAATGGTAGGGFVLSSSVTITAAITAGPSKTCMTTSGTPTVFIIGNLTGGASVDGNPSHAITISTAINLSVTGNVSGGTISSTNHTSFGIYNTAASVISITGDISGGTHNGGSSASIGGVFTSAGSLTINGNVTGPSGTGASMTINTSGGIVQSGSASTTVTGTVTSGGLVSNGFGILSNGGTIVVNGDVVSSSSSGIKSDLTTVTLNGSAISGSLGYAPVGSGIVLLHATSALTHTYRVNNSGSAGVARSLYTGGTNIGQPVVANVRSGTVYGAASEYTGTLAVPSPTLVAIGVSTDNTVGSYAPTGGLDAAGVRTAIGLASANLDTQLSGIQSDTNDIQTRLPAALESGRIAAVLDSAATAALVDLIWDEPLTGATHNVATSSGKRLRQTTAFQQIDATVNDAAASTTTFITTLSSSVDNFYNDSMLVFTDGALAGQVRAIYDYIGATKTIILEEALTSAPANGVAFTIVSLHIHPVSQIQSGLATSAALATESLKLNRIEAVATGTVTGAGTSTEVFVGPSATLTITVDSSGNRSAVVVT